MRMRLKFLFRTALDLLGLFSGPDCGAVCIYAAGRMVHYTNFTPRYWRFAFIGGDDLQIGDTWTDPEYRGKGLAQFALARILTLKRRPGRLFWYCVEAINTPSIRVAEHAGFEVVAEGEWKKPFGIKLLGSYVPTRKVESAGARIFSPLQRPVR